MVTTPQEVLSDEFDVWMDEALQIHVMHGGRTVEVLDSKIFSNAIDAVWDAAYTALNSKARLLRLESAIAIEEAMLADRVREHAEATSLLEECQSDATIPPPESPTLKAMELAYESLLEMLGDNCRMCIELHRSVQHTEEANRQYDALLEIHNELKKRAAKKRKKLKKKWRKRLKKAEEFTSGIIEEAAAEHAEQVERNQQLISEALDLTERMDAQSARHAGERVEWFERLHAETADLRKRAEFGDRARNFLQQAQWHIHFGFWLERNERLIRGNGSRGKAKLSDLKREYRDELKTAG